MYRSDHRWASLPVVVLCAIGVVSLLASGCQTAPAEEPEVSIAGKPDSEILYDAVLVEFREQELEVDSASRRFLVVTSTFHAVTERLRRRFTARIVRLSGGATGLRINAEYQRRHGDGDRADWKDAESDAVGERAERAELKLGRAVEKRFRRWKAYESANQ